MKFNLQCPLCGGTGRVSNECATCYGQGVITKRETVEFRIKPGTRDGQRIRLAGKGNAGTNGGAAGDLYLIVKAGPHPVFTRVADDIYVTVPVTVGEAALGAKIDVPTVDGRTQLKIPPEDADGAEAAAAREGRAVGCTRGDARRPDRGSEDRGAEGAGRAEQGDPARAGEVE